MRIVRPVGATDATSVRSDAAAYLPAAAVILLIVIAGTFGWTIAPLEHLRPTPANVAAGALTFVLGLIVVRARWGARHLVQRSTTVVPELAPPEGIRPAEADLLVHGRPHRRDVSATVIDLALRGFLRVREGTDAEATPTWVLERVATATDDLQRYERAALAALFAHGPRVLLGSLEPRFYIGADLVEDELDREMVGRGWFVDPPGRLRSRWATAGWLTALAGIPLTFVFGNAAGLGLVGAAVFAIGVVVYALAPWRPARTAAGQGLGLRVAGFELFLRTAEQERQRFAERERLFEDYLPYAIAFGLVEQWVRGFGLVDRPGDFDDTHPPPIPLREGLVGLVRQLDARPDDPRRRAI